VEGEVKGRDRCITEPVLKLEASGPEGLESIASTGLRSERRYTHSL
jgi:hypothetical protein